VGDLKLIDFFVTTMLCIIVSVQGKCLSTKQTNDTESLFHLQNKHFQTLVRYNPTEESVPEDQSFLPMAVDHQ